MTLRAVFIRPSNKTGSAYMTKWGFLPAPLSLLTLAGEIRRIQDSSIKIIDMEGDKLTLDDAVEEALQFKPDLVGITLHATAAHNTAGYIARKIKEKSPETILVAGGHHATFLPNEIIRSGFDISVLGEGDETIFEIAMAIAENMGFQDIPGIVYRCGDEIKKNRPRKLIADLDSLPLPPFDLLDPSRYTFSVFGADDRVMCLETSRGCPYACDFCSVTPTWGNMWRNKSNKRILEEMRLAKAAGYNWIFFTDDIFVVHPNVKHREQLFDRILEEKLDMKWIVQMRADVTAKHPDLIRKGSEAGMRISFLGVESGSEEILKKMHKGEFTPQSVEAVKILDQSGIIVLIGMMIGAPYERFRDVISTIRFSRQLEAAGADAVQFSIYTPLPGTRIFDDALRTNALFTLDWDRYDVLTPVMKTDFGPVRDQIAQFYASYSFYIHKFLRDKLKGVKKTVIKTQLVNNAYEFILKMMPQYLRGFVSFPRHIFQTYDLYWHFRKHPNLDAEKVSEALETSNKIVYDQEKKRNPYFMIKESR
ncbi:MAG: B12-binding domain-containing radical SAM protein [Candidatus Thermoplasmatota archaeon]|nr:B12-binding domain-containing radical SAM protein [Candidatus Thermoplasmatota archaeon]